MQEAESVELIWECLPYRSNYQTLAEIKNEDSYLLVPLDNSTGTGLTVLY